MNNYNGKQINFSNEDILDIEDKVMNAITAILWKLESE
jgi:hypothetical protein